MVHSQRRVDGKVRRVDTLGNNSLASARVEGSGAAVAKRARRAMARRRMPGAMRANSSSTVGLRRQGGGV